MESLDIALPLLDSNACILFLGPQFASDANGQKIHEVLKTQYGNYKPAIDLNFDNLLIFKDPKVSNIEVIKLKSGLKKLYTDFKPNPIYESIAEIPFQAIVCCSPDLFLDTTFKAKRIPIEFQFYSPKGHPPDAVTTDLPIVYNVFGKYDTPDSLINTYDSFFDFVFTMMGDKNNIPINLKNMFANAKGFVFLGFDMDKWYIPLLIRKMNDKKNEITAILTADNFPKDFVVDNAKAELEKKFHPIEIFIANQEQGMALLNELYTNLKTAGKTRSQTLHLESVVPLNPIETLLDADKLTEATNIVLQQLKNKQFDKVVESVKIFIKKIFIREAFTLITEGFNQRQKNINDLTLVQSTYASIQQDRDRGKISDENYRIALAKVVDALTNLCDELNT